MMIYLNFHFVILLLYMKYAFGQNGNAEFVVDDQALFYIDQNLTWNEASSLCRSFHSSLITIKGSSFASHVLEALASFKVQKLVWIGGRLIHDQWMWKMSGLPIQYYGDNFNFSRMSNNNSNLIIKHQCLAVNTSNYLKPAFVSLKCSDERPTLCQKAQQQPLLLVEEFVYNNHNYSIYEGQSSWQTAVGICHKHNMYLAVLSDVMELQEVSLTLASYTHLDINDVWVGALKDLHSWEWLSTGDAVEHDIENNNNTFLKCLSLKIKTQIFSAENCSSGSAFVCESRQPDDDFWESFVHQSTEYTIHSLKTTWERANEICQVENSALATVEDLSHANMMIVNMRNSWEVLPSVWLGAKTVQVDSKFRFKWVDSNEDVPLIANGFPPWKKTSVELDKNMCLILVKSKNNASFLENSLCDNAHGFICQRDSSVPLAISMNFKIGDKDLLFHDKPETWQKAQDICGLANSRLLFISDPDDLLTIKRFTTRHKLWLDGTYEDNKWQWKYDATELPSIDNMPGLLSMSNNNLTTRNCLSIYIQNSRAKFIASSCKAKLPYICERNTQKEQLIKYKGTEYTVVNKHLTWHEASAVCQARDQNLAETCDTNEAEFLSKLVTAYGDLWLGGIKREAKWVWDAANATLPHKTVKTIGYPPWLLGQANRNGVACLTLTKGPSLNAAFMDTSCNEIKSFVCEKYSVQNHKHVFLLPRVTVLKDRQYMFYPQLNTWKDASEECSDNLAFLAMVSTPEIARHIAKLTYGHPEIWIGGVLQESVWKWSINGETIKSWGENETQWVNENEISDEEYETKANYLALNRLNPNIPLFVKSYGNERLGFVCERANNVEEEEYLVEKVSIESGDLYFFEEKLNYTDAHDVCQSKNGVLVNADNPELLKLIAKHARKFHGAWLGATLTTQSQQFLWTHIRKVVEDEIELFSGELLVAKRRSKRYDFRDETLDRSEIEYEINAQYDRSDFNEEEEENEDENNAEETLENTEENESEMMEDHHNYVKRAVSDNPSTLTSTICVGTINEEDVVIDLTTTDTTTLHSASYNIITDLVKYDLLHLETTEVQGLSKLENLKETTEKIVEKPTMKDVLTTNSNSQNYDSNNLSDENVSESTDSKTSTTIKETTAASSTIIELTTSTTGTPAAIVEELSRTEETATEEATTETLVDNITVKLVNELLKSLVYCLKIDEDGKLIAMDCSSRQSFVCEIRSNNTNRVIAQEFSSKNVNYIVSNEQLSWHQAYKKCNKTFGGYLAIFDNFDELHFIKNISKDFQDLWIGAKYYDSWTWPYIYQYISENISYWSTLDWKYKCANVYRQHSMELLLVDRNCTERHGFICKDGIFCKGKAKAAKYFTSKIQSSLNYNGIDKFDVTEYYTKADAARFRAELVLLTEDRLFVAGGKTIAFLFSSTKKILLEMPKIYGHGTTYVRKRSFNVERKDHYTIHWKPANYFEALSTCAQHGTILASGQNQILDIINLHKGLHSIWISALYINGNWIWLANNTNFLSRDDFDVQHLPGHECISIFKRNSQSYSSIDRDCDTYLPFVCENVNNGSITFNNKRYTYHLIKKTWLEANNYCASNGQQLAIAKNNQSAALIQNIALMTNDIWVDGIWSNNLKWEWEFTGEIISEDPLMHYNMSKPSKPIPNDSCLYANNFMNGPQLLSYTSCSAPKAFLCQGVSVSDVPLIESIEIDNRIYTIYSRLATWDEARELCSSNGTYLIVIDALEELAVLDYFKLDTFWIGGQSLQNGDSWIWEHTGDDIISEVSPKEKSNFGKFKDCLNFYREGNNNTFIAQKCNMKLPFVCEEVGHNSKTQVRRIDLQNEYLVLHNLQLNWNDAKDMCVSAGQHLASITEDNAEHFLNLPLEYHDLWIDGRNEDDVWIWTELDVEINSSYDIFKTNLSNTFVRSIARPNYNCLNLYRPTITTFAFLDRQCNNKFGFICQGTKQMQDQIKTVVLGGRVYNIYTKKSTWYQANNICKANGTYLAVLNTTEEIELLTHSPISFVKLWTGAIEKDGNWIWDHTGTEIVPNVYTKYLTTLKQCGIIKRSNKGAVALLPKNCTMSYAFVCEERGDQGKWTTQSLNVSGHYYSFYSERATWTRASDICQENGQYLSLIDTEEEMQVINQFNIDFHDLWVGATRNEGSETWTWTHTGQEFAFDEANSNLPKFTKKTVQHRCLNIYREWNSDSLFIDRNCNEPHGYICESAPISKDHPEVLRTSFGGHLYILIQQPLTWMQAYQACDQFNGYLAIVSSQTEADFLNSINSDFHDLWIGGNNFINTSWTWYYTGQKISDHINWQRKSTRENHNCLNLYTADEKTGIFMDRKCTEAHSFICEETHQYGQINSFKSNDLASFESGVLDQVLFPPKYLPYYVTLNGKTYMFSNVRVNFETALNACKQNFGYLAILEDQLEMEFIGNNTEGYHNLWIGGKRYENDWIWWHLGAAISPDNFLDYHQARQNHNCLSFYRHDNTTSYFIDRKCEEKRSFVCKDVIQEIQEIQQEVTYNNRYYLAVPNTQITWVEAEEFCRSQGGYLAIVDNSNEANFLATLGNDLWIDAKFDDTRNTWIWNHIRQEIRFDNYEIETHVPSFTDTQQPNCLNLYRNFNNTPGFVERNCNDKFGFVCEDLVAISPNILTIRKEYNERKYIFVNDRLPWQEAYDSCRQNGSYLAIISTKQEGKFIAKMANDFHDIWIDGLYKQTIWISNYTGQSIEGVYSEKNGTVDGDLNEWTTTEIPVGFDCLNSYLPSSDAFFFIGRNCSENHSYVCEEVIEEPISPKSIEYNGILYTIQMEPVTWEEANKRCSKHGYLAIIDTIDEASELVKSIGDFHSLWIGAQYNREEWIWNYTGEVIDPDVNLWANAAPRSNFNCSILYRDNFMVPFIVDQSCNDKFGYICEEGETWHNTETNEIVRHDGKMYTFYGIALTWGEAKQYCETSRSTLAVIDNLQLAVLLTQQKEYYDFWIDGISEGLLFTWSSTGIFLPRFETSDIKYVRVIPKTETSCLSLFRSNNTVRYLDESCNITKPFLCQKYDSLLGGNVTAIKRNNTQYYLVNGVEKTWFEAWEICAANGSYLPIIKDADTAEFVSSLYPYAAGEIWLGARKLSNWWSWQLTEEALIEAETEKDFPIWSRLNQPNNKCLAIDHRTTMYPVYTDLNCSVSKQVICQQGCPALPKVNGMWSRTECTTRVHKIGEHCKLNCKNGYLLAGVSNISCTSNSWSSKIPICLSIRDYSLSIVSNVNAALNTLKKNIKFKKNIGLLFLLDTSNGVGWEHYQSMLEVIKSISVGVGAAENNILQGVISFEAEAKNEFGFGKIKTCSFIQNVDKLVYKPKSDVVSYKNAFDTAREVLENANVSGSSVVFMITSNNSTENLDLFNIKQNGNIVIVVGIKPQVSMNLIQQLATPGSLKHQWNLNNWELNEVAYVLNRTYLYSGKLSCCMRLKNTNGLSISPPSCIRDVSKNNDTCSIKCHSQYHLQGIESLICTSEGWQSTLDLKRPFPECYTTQQVTSQFINTLEWVYQLKYVDSTIFLIDQSGSMLEDDFYTEIKFVKLLLRIASASTGVIVFSSEAYVEIPLMNYKEPESLCSLYDHLNSLRFSGGSTNYEKAFAATHDEIKSYMKNCTDCSQQRTLIVMLTDGQNSEMIESAENLKSEGHIIIILSIAVDKRHNLIKIASNSDDNLPLLFSLNTFQDLQTMSLDINNKLLQNSTIICCRIPEEFQTGQAKMFVLENDMLDVNCAPGYALSVENSTLTCTETGLNVVPTCFAVPKTIADYLNIQFYRIINRFHRTKQQIVVFLIDQTETMTPDKNNQALTFIKSSVTLLGISENRTVGLINGQNHESTMLIEPNITCPDKFSELLNNISFNSTSYSLYKPLKYILDNLITENRNVLTIIISDRVYISTPSLKLAEKIMSSESSLYVMEVHNDTTESNIAQLVEDRNDFFIAGYYMLKDNLYSIDSFETLEAVAENIYRI